MHNLYKLNYKIIYFITIILLILIFFWRPAAALAQGEGEPQVAYYSQRAAGVEWAQLAAGAVGEGWLVYYVPERGVEVPSLVVRLSKQAAGEGAVAEVFDAPPGLDYVPVDIEGDRVSLASGALPIMRIEALDGWWVRQEEGSASQVVNYNLDVEIRGAIAAMSGTSYDEELGPQGWPEFVQRGELAVNITVRDPELSGLPQWELRLLEPAFQGRGYFRSTYAERKCETPIEAKLGVSPLWPFVALEGGYELARGEQRPPIVVDWQAAKVSYFSELLAVHQQNCVYAFNSVNKLVENELNQANYETPLAFYDLSGEGVGYPNLLLRSERYPAQDPWIGGLEKDLQMIRYSWRNKVGDGQWDYKIDVLGFHPYSNTTSIADGAFTIDAPAYDALPAWVLEKEWPVATFIDSEENSYQSDEGLYEWSPREVGVGYALGWQEAHAGDAFTRIREGLRGEYRFRRSLSPELYLSPIDNRLHLLGAEGGLWQIDEQVVLRQQNLGDELYLNGWIREQATSEESSNQNEVVEMLYALEGHLLYSSSDEVILRQSTYDPVRGLFPPKDAATWQALNQQLAPFTISKRDPLDFKSWLYPFEGASMVIQNAQLSQMRAIENGFRFVLQLDPAFTISESDLFDSSAFAAGTYLIQYDGQWQVDLLTLPDLSLTVELLTAEEQLSILDESLLQAVVQNSGLTDVKNVQLVGIMRQDGETWPITRQKIELLAGSRLSIPLNLHPKSVGAWTLEFWLEDQDKNVLVETSQQINVPVDKQSGGWTIFSLSTGVGKQSLSLLLLLAFAVSMIYALFMSADKGE